jgi:glutaredoxin 2
VDQEFISKELPALVNDFFKDSLDPVNTETLTQAYSYAHGEYLKANVGKMLERAYSKGAVEAAEKTVNRYENRSGLPRAEENTVIVSNQNAMDDFINKQMLGK